MPIIKSAKKKLRQSAKKEKVNMKYKSGYEKAIRNITKNKASKGKATLLKEAYSQIDKAVKKKIIHKKKGARLKAKVAKLVSIKK